MSVPREAEPKRERVGTASGSVDDIDRPWTSSQMESFAYAAWRHDAGSKRVNPNRKLYETRIGI
jgi:hypothetical protein